MAVKVMLKQVREARGFSQNELARRVDMTSQYIQKIEQGRSRSIPYETLDKFCKELRCQVGDILVYVPDNDTTEEPRY